MGKLTEISIETGSFFLEVPAELSLESVLKQHLDKFDSNSDWYMMVILENWTHLGLVELTNPGGGTELSNVATCSSMAAL